MSEEKKTKNDKENTDNFSDSSVNGFFDSLIEDFEKNSDGSGKNSDKPLGMKDFSRFFNDAAAFGGGFESTIDNGNKESLSDGTEGKKISFSADSIITTPVTDEDGMIVIYDEEAGIDATMTLRGGNVIPEENFSSDSNIGDDEKSTSDSGDASVRKPPFISSLLPWKGDSGFEVVRKIIFIASICVFAGAGVMLISTLQQSEEAVDEQSSIIAEVTTTVATSINSLGETVTIPPTTSERVSHAESLMNSFVQVSGNVKGFIELPACDIYYPVVQGTDNDYYLTHTYDDRKNKAGAIFIDYRCTLSEEYTSPNIVIYGHNQEDGTMFGKLKKYKNNVDFYKQNPMITFNTDFGYGDYVIFGYFVSNVYEYQDSEGEVFHYHDYIETLNDEATFNWYMAEVAERNQIISPVDVKFGDKLLVLSTCSTEYSNSRFVIMARKLRDGESVSSFDFSNAALNPYARQIDWSAILSQKSITVTTTEITTVTEETTTTQATAETTAAPETTTVTTVTTTEPTATTTAADTAATTLTTTTVSTVPTADAAESKAVGMGLVPKYENGTTASIVNTAEDDTEQFALPQSVEETTTSHRAPKYENGTTAAEEEINIPNEDIDLDILP